MHIHQFRCTEIRVYANTHREICVSACEQAPRNARSFRALSSSPAAASALRCHARHRGHTWPVSRANSLFSRGVGGGWVGPPGPYGGFGIGIGKKYSAHPLSPTHHPRILIRSTIFQWKSSGTIKSRSFYKFIIWNPVCGFHDVYPSIELVCCGNI